jgi:hypothetical protein
MNKYLALRAKPVYRHNNSEIARKLQGLLNRYAATRGHNNSNNLFNNLRGPKLTNAQYKALTRVSKNNLRYAGRIRKNTPGPAPNMNQIYRTRVRNNAANTLAKKLPAAYRSYKGRIFKKSMANRTFNAGQRGQMSLPSHLINKILKMGRM